MESNTQSQTVHPKAQLNLCLTNLFQVPNQNIEKAFALILELLEKQQLEHRELQLAHVDLEKQHKELNSSLRKEFEESNETLKKQFDKDIGQLQESMKILRKERDDLLRANDQMKDNQCTFQKKLDEMKEDVKTMAYNLQLEPTSEEVLVLDEDMQETDKGDDSESSSIESGAQDNHNERTDLNTNNDVVNQEESISLKSGQSEDNNMDNETKSIESVKKVDDSPLEQSPPTISDLEKGVSRRGSVLSRKLQVHETLAARLDRIESDKERMKQDLIDITRKLGNVHANEGKPLYAPLSDELDSIATLQRRLISLEQFLAGFGVSSIDIGGEVKVIDSLDKKSTIEPNNLLSKRKRSFDEEEDNEENESISDVSNIDDSESEETTAHRPSTMNQRQEDENSKNEAAQSNTAQATSPNSPTDQSTDGITNENALIKPRGLLMHLLEQEKKFQQNLNFISKRLMTLEDKLKAKVGRDSLDNLLRSATPQKEPIEKGEGGSVLDAALYDDSILSSQIEELKGALETLRNDLGSKVSKEMLMKEFELHRSQSILSQLEGTSGNNIDDATLKQLQAMIQNELDYLRKQKVDKELYAKELEESKSHVLGEVQQTLSSHEAKMTDSITKFGNDLSNCEENIKMLQDVIERRYAEAEDLNLDEKIRSATKAMESSLQELISSRLGCLKAMEDEVEKLASGLAEKPDQGQIDAMLQNLEKAVSARIGSDDTFQSILQGMKSELKEKMTRNEVLFLLKQALNGAKEDVKRNGNSLMVGHQPYRCLSCDKVHPQGVNNVLAPKVNHNSLPQGRGLAPAVYPYCSAVGGSVKMGRGGALRPLRRSQTSIDSLRRSRRWTSSDRRMHSRKSR